MLTPCLDRLEETIDLETAALRARDLTGLEDFSRRKSQALLELSKVLRSLNAGAPGEFEADRIVRLQEKLEINLELLGTHKRAAQEIASMIAGAIERTESDGTYLPPLNLAGVSA